MSSRLLEILGKAMSFDVCDLIWHWFRAVESREGTPESERARKLERIINLALTKRGQTAEQQLCKYLAENPLCIYGHLAAASLLLEKNHLKDALEHLQHVFSQQPSNTMALYAMGHCCERLGRESDALEYYQDCLKFKGYLQFPRQRLAAIYLKNGQLEKAAREYESLRSEYPGDLVTLSMLGHLYSALGRHCDAAEAHNSAILMHPDNFRRQPDYIDELVEEGRFNEALEELDNASGHESKLEMLLKRADVLSAMGATEESTQQYELAAEDCPDSLEAAIKLGSEYLQSGQTEKAAHQFNRAVEINDRIVESYIGLSLSYLLAQNRAEALAMLSLASSINGNSSALLAESAILQFKTELNARSEGYESLEPEQLISPVMRAHQKEAVERPNNPELHYRLGILMTATQHPDQARMSLEAALAINPTYAQARNKLALCLYDTNQKEAALDILPGPTCLAKDILELHYRTALLYCDRIRFASTLLNLDHTLSQSYAALDPTMNIAVVLQNLCLLDRTSSVWDSLAGTAERAIDSGSAFSEDQP